MNLDKRALMWGALAVLVLGVGSFSGAEILEGRGCFGRAGVELGVEGCRGNATLGDLPVVAQAAISTAIGRDQASYHAVATEVKAGALRFQRLPQPGPSYRFKDRPHALEVEFTAAGVTVQSGGAVLGLEFVGYGYGSSVEAVDAAEPWAEANRVEYRRGR